jgi:uncharacterized protein YegP (UPF0339 family)
MAGKFVLKSTGKGKFSFNLQAGNGRVILSSESYTSKDAAKDGIASVRKYAESDGNFERRTAKNKQPYFVLRAGNLEVIGKSEMYTALRSAEKGISSVKAHAVSAVFEDLTVKK